jgi:hypothetical protein
MSETELQRIRVQFDMGKESVERLDRIRERTAASSRADVIRRALGLYQYVLEELEDNAVLYFEKKGGEKTRIVFPDLIR